MLHTAKQAAHAASQGQGRQQAMEQRRQEFQVNCAQQKPMFNILQKQLVYMIKWVDVIQKYYKNDGFLSEANS